MLNTLLSHSPIGIFSHLKPDGDCIGSQIAISRWLSRNGADVRAFNEDKIPANLLWLSDFFPVTAPTEEALEACSSFLFVDGNALHRFGKYAEKLQHSGKPLYMIDHHPQPEAIFTKQISEVSASSTCEIITRLLLDFQPQGIDTATAKALYAGMVTDTGSFQFDSVRPETLRLAATLLETGNFTPDEVVERIFSVKKINHYALLQRVLTTLKLHANQQIATMCVTENMFKETDTMPEDTEGFVNYALQIEGVKVAILFREDKDKIKISLRSRSDIDVNLWARQFSGGGHQKAAGAQHPGPLKHAVDDILSYGKTLF